MIAPLERFRVRFHDWLHYSRLPRELIGGLHFVRSKLPGDRVRKLEHAIQAYRFSGLSRIKQSALRAFKKHAPGAIWREQKIGWSRYAEQLKDPALSRSVILKAPGNDGEKGVLLITFEYNWLRLLSGVADLDQLEAQYDIIFSTSSSPSNYALLGLALSSLSGTVFVQACNHAEIAEIEALHPRIKCLDTLPCDWLEPKLFVPKPFAERDIDILMVAGWAPVKRQWQFFEALKSMPHDLRIVMIGQAEGRYDIEHARRSAKLFGAHQAIEFHQSLSIDEVAEFQSRSKISLIFSRREGCCVAVTESFFADTPVGLIADAHIGPKAYINPKDGVLLDRKGDLGSQLIDFLKNAERFEARKWAIANISAHASTEHLNQLLKDYAEEQGRAWTGDLLVPCWRAHPTLAYNPRRDDLRPAYLDLHERYPAVFPADLIDHSHR